MRRAHQLSENKKQTVPKRMVFFDSESHVHIDITDEEVSRARAGQDVSKPHKLYLIVGSFVAQGGTKKKQIDEMRDYTGKNLAKRFWSDVDSFSQWKTRTYVYAHNAKYDTLVTSCIPFMVSLGYEVEGFSDSNPFILRLVKKNATGKIDKRTGKEIIDCKTVIVLSSTNYYQTSLAKLGEVFGLDKLEHDHSGETSLDDSITYCRRDVEIIKTAMLAFFRFLLTDELGNAAVTVAGQAFNAFRHRFMQHDIFIHDNAAAIATERRAYAGGRNECWYIGEIPHEIYGVDVNSMYPSVMWGNLFPTELVGFRKKMTLAGIQKNLDNGLLVCADCLVETDIPIFHLKEDKLIFPTGTFWTSLSTPEIIEGLQRGLIKQVENVALYQGAPIFDAYVDYFYTKRLAAKAADDEVHNFLYKLFLNCLYGKFGQKNEKWERIADADPKEIGEERIHFEGDEGLTLIKTFGGGVFKKVDDPDDEEAFNSFPAVAAHVTAYARMMLWGYIETAGLDNVFYMDTDSLFVTEEGYKRLESSGVIHDSKLGSLALEKTGRMVTFGCKDYEFTHDTGKQKGKTDIKTKGVNKSAKYIGENEHGQKQFAITQWSGYAQALRKKHMDSYENKVIIKTLKREYDKGTISDTGHVNPFVYEIVFAC